MRDGGLRFAFGENWRRFLPLITDERLRAAEESLCTMLDAKDLQGKTFLDVGCGSGLFSLAARRLGATVRSFDFDPISVECALRLRQQHRPDDPGWIVSPGSVLDSPFMDALGQFDVVYAWGVLHHTGSLWQALDHTIRAVAPGGRLFIALYNDQGLRSALWREVKRAYCSSTVGRLAVLATFIPAFAAGCFTMDVLRGSNPLARYRASLEGRGMSQLHDWIDWLGGLPFEVATPAETEAFCGQRGLSLLRLNPTPTNGCNELVFGMRAR